VILQTKEISVSFSGIIALNRLSFDVTKGAIMGLIGPNGAGKSTFFNVISRIYKPDRGDILFKGKSLLTYAPHNIANEGIYRTFQTPEVFQRLTVLENILLGVHLAFKSGFISRALNLRRARKEERQWRESAIDLLKQLGLSQYADETADNLPLVFQRRMEIARALLNKPSMLLLDEPTAGMNYEEKQDIIQFIKQVRKEGEITVILIEHDIKLIRKICDHLVVLNFGEKIAEGPPEEVSKNKHVIKAYLGEN
jgi:branched-chain amino acid transport system ATP-binding protein